MGKIELIFEIIKGSQKGSNININLEILNILNNKDNILYEIIEELINKKNLKIINNFHNLYSFYVSLKDHDKYNINNYFINLYLVLLSLLRNYEIKEVNMIYNYYNKISNFQNIILNNICKDNSIINNYIVENINDFFIIFVNNLKIVKNLKNINKILNINNFKNMSKILKFGLPFAEIDQIMIINNNQIQDKEFENLLNFYFNNFCLCFIEEIKDKSYYFYFIICLIEKYYETSKLSIKKNFIFLNTFKDILLNLETLSIDYLNIFNKAVDNKEKFIDLKNKIKDLNKNNLLAKNEFKSTVNNLYQKFLKNNNLEDYKINIFNEEISVNFYDIKSMLYLKEKNSRIKFLNHLPYFILNANNLKAHIKEIFDILMEFNELDNIDNKIELLQTIYFLIFLKNPSLYFDNIIRINSDKLILFINKIHNIRYIINSLKIIYDMKKDESIISLPSKNNIFNEIKNIKTIEEIKKNDMEISKLNRIKEKTKYFKNYKTYEKYLNLNLVYREIIKVFSILYKDTNYLIEYIKLLQISTIIISILIRKCP